MPDDLLLNRVNEIERHQHQLILSQVKLLSMLKEQFKKQDTIEKAKLVLLKKIGDKK